MRAVVGRGRRESAGVEGVKWAAWYAVSQRQSVGGEAINVPAGAPAARDGSYCTSMEGWNAHANPSSLRVPE